MLHKTLFFKGDAGKCNFKMSRNFCCISLALRVEGIAMIMVSGLGFLFCFSNNLISPRVPTLENSHLPWLPWAHSVSLLTIPPLHPFPTPCLQCTFYSERTTGAFCTSSWGFVGLFFFFLSLFGGVTLFYVSSVAEYMYGQDFTMFS